MAQTAQHPFVCRKCDYGTDVLRAFCPECGGDIIANPAAE
jgi:hypothetical protein